MATATKKEQAVATRDDTALVKRETVDIVAEKIRMFQENGELHLPANYSPENAIKSAWLILQETVDRDKRPVLEVCTKPSIANSLLNMVLQGLNPEKDQCYFIAYGNKLVCQRSYFGTAAVAKRILELEDIVATAVYKDDEFEYEIDPRGRKQVTRHVQKLEHVGDKNIIAGYCTLFWPDGRFYTDIMTIDQIKQAWKKSQMRPVDDKGNVKAGSTHSEFGEEMAKKTVLGRACKGYINSSDDSSLIIKAFRQSDDEVTEAMLEEEIAENANRGEVVDVEYETVETAPAEVAGSAHSNEEQKEATGEPVQESLAATGTEGTRGPDF